ncbi:peroxiredoxin, partial [Wolbachia endosymbiont of Glossina morsitans morsitans]
PGCTMEAKGFRDKIDDFSFLDTVIIGISKDSVRCHTIFKAKYSLPFSLVSDENAEMLGKYGVWVEKSMFGKKYMGIERTTFLIDKKGKIVKIWKNVKVSGHVDEVLEEVKRI